MKFTKDNSLLNVRNYYFAICCKFSQKFINEFKIKNFNTSNHYLRKYKVKTENLIFPYLCKVSVVKHLKIKNIFRYKKYF